MAGNRSDSRLDSTSFTVTKFAGEAAGSPGDDLISDWGVVYAESGAQVMANDLWTIEGFYREDGSEVMGTTLNVDNEVLPQSYSLDQNYPNPFNPSTSINFTLQSAGEVSLKVYDVNGVEVAQLASGNYEAGQHRLNFNPENMSSGTYLYVLETGSFREVKRMVYLK